MGAFEHKVSGGADPADVKLDGHRDLQADTAYMLMGGKRARFVGDCLMPITTRYLGSWMLTGHPFKYLIA